METAPEKAAEAQQRAGEGRMAGEAATRAMWRETPWRRLLGTRIPRKASIPSGGEERGQAAEVEKIEEKRKGSGGEPSRKQEKGVVERR